MYQSKQKSVSQNAFLPQSLHISEKSSTFAAVYCKYCKLSIVLFRAKNSIALSSIEPDTIQQKIEQIKQTT